ncbi:MAG: 2-isopropylmalate synthase [Deltaproteobacteria bacterium]|nr:2-isopropylmalate synthase [Deltaproteobacteria bacterium]MBW2150522.1 2-isopropylmalate synthase [Deltaproteobacteria bacterium]
MSQLKQYPSLKEDSCVSHYNLLEEIRHGFQFPEKVFLKDQTLREGEQAAMSGFSLQNKIDIARMLDDVGVHYIQVGYPGLSESENRMIKTIAGLGLKTKVGGIALVYLPEWKEQIEQALDTGISWISVAYGLSPVRLQHMMKVPLQEAVDRILNATECAARKGLHVQFSATDTTRTPLDTLLDLYRRAVDAGASMVSVSDTAGAMGPTAMRYLVRKLIDTLDVPVGVHTHNDLGLAMANAIAAIEAGASLVDVTVNGIGERAGNASLDEVATVLTHVYGYDLGLDLRKMKVLSEKVAELSGIPVPSTKPLVGDNAFTHTLGAHQWGVRQAWFTYEPVRAEAVGNIRRLPLGRLTHHLLVRDKLREAGFFDLNDETVKQITEEIRALSEKEARFVTDKEMVCIARKKLG